jgi:macrolide-specific efflux system membrane fusion protein
MHKHSKKIKIILVFVILAAVGFFWHYNLNQRHLDKETIKELHPVIGNIQRIISTTGTVLPKNRLEIKPPVNGRIEEVLVKEGQDVAAGEILTWMSSTERAALIDAARGQGQETLKYWKEAYRAISLISPIKGEVIVAKIQPGQTVTTNDAVVVLSDELIVRAQVDETDIGKIKLGQNAIIILDAYPDTQIKANVDHIYYESKTVNNVTIYEVDLLPESIPDFFRSGMNTTINFVESSKDGVLLLTSEAILKEKDQAYVLLKQAGQAEYIKQPVQTGMSDDKNVEIVSGLSLNDTVVIKTKKYMLPQNSIGTNPFMPLRGQRNKGQQSR